MELSIGEMLVIAIVIIVLFGPDKLPQIARELGSGVRKMRGAMEDIKTEIMKETDNPVAEIKKEIEKVKNSVAEANPLEQVKDDFFSLDNTPKPEDAVEGSNNTEVQNKPDPKDDETYEGPVSR